MTVQDIQERIKELQAQRSQTEANLNAIGGAIQDCHFWLEKLSQQHNKKGK
jgi:septal ring factor EnvC (AmiA/AmiB activator)